MAGKITITTRGGHRARAFVRQRIRDLKRLEAKAHTAGFHDKQMAALASRHEYGLRGEDGRSTLPERPAYRAAKPDVARAWLKATRKAAAELSKPGGDARAVERLLRRGAKDAREALRESYRGFRGVPLGEAQRARKRGTPGQGKQLTGHKGERLIDHIEARTPDGDTIK